MELGRLKESLAAREDELEKAKGQFEERDAKVRSHMGAGAVRNQSHVAAQCAARMPGDVAVAVPGLTALERAVTRPLPTPLQHAPTARRPALAQVREMEEVVRQSQRYSATLQAYNTRCVPCATDARRLSGMPPCRWRALGGGGRLTSAAPAGSAAGSTAARPRPS